MPKPVPDYREYTGAKITLAELIDIENNALAVRPDTNSDRVAKLVKDARRMIIEIREKLEANE